MNEFQMIKELIKSQQTLKSENLGVGDDCSAIPFDEKRNLITSKDILVERKHFDLSDVSMEDLGFKSLAVNISDIASMGGVAKWCHLALAIPEKIKNEDIKNFFKGFYQLASAEGVELLGGDLSASNNDFVISVTISGLVEKDNMKLRSGFEKLGILCVTAPLGNSAAGLKLINQNKKETSEILVRSHYRPMSYHKEGQWLGRQSHVYGMMDLSDSLMSALEQLSTSCAKINIEQIPISDELQKVCKEQGWDPLEFAVAGGEDYCLMFSVQEEALERLQADYIKKFKRNIYRIGSIQKGGGKTLWFKNKVITDLPYKSYFHFE